MDIQKEILYLIDHHRKKKYVTIISHGKPRNQKIEKT
jgi:hypothetical protein